MTMYDYVAQSNPRGAKSIIESFGYKVANPRTMGSNLRMLVAQEGEPALRAIAEMHPDKDLIVEVFSKEETGKKDSYFGLDGLGLISESNKNSQAQQNQSDSTKLAMQTNVFLIVATIIIASAIIVNKN